LTGFTVLGSSPSGGPLPSASIGSCISAASGLVSSNSSGVIRVPTAHRLTTSSSGHHVICGSTGPQSMTPVGSTNGTIQSPVGSTAMPGGQAAPPSVVSAGAPAGMTAAAVAAAAAACRLSAMMFPWMRERKDGMTCKFMCNTNLNDILPNNNIIRYEVEELGKLYVLDAKCLNASALVDL
jgi:hypothetical protein